MKEQMKSKKFIVLVVMTILNAAYIGICKDDSNLIQLMPLMITLNGVYATYLGVNVWQKKNMKIETK